MSLPDDPPPPPFLTGPLQLASGDSLSSTPVVWVPSRTRYASVASRAPFYGLMLQAEKRRATAPFGEFVLAERLPLEGLDLPVLVRFTDILKDRVDVLTGAFSHVIKELHYAGHYTAVYPIKVNQQESVVKAIVAHGAERVGLEAGSKPELAAVLGLAPAGSIIVCNGYKDRGYIRRALIGAKLGQHPPADPFVEQRLRVFHGGDRVGGHRRLIGRAFGVGLRSGWDKGGCPHTARPRALLIAAHKPRHRTAKLRK